MLSSSSRGQERAPLLQRSPLPRKNLAAAKNGPSLLQRLCFNRKKVKNRPPDGERARARERRRGGRTPRPMIAQGAAVVGQGAPGREPLVWLVRERRPSRLDAMLQRLWEGLHGPRLAAMLQSLWAGLHGLGRVHVELPVAEEDTGGLECRGEDTEDVTRGLQRPGCRYADMYDPKLQPRQPRRKKSPPPPPPAPHPVLVVNGVTLLEDEKVQYTEYCRRAAMVSDDDCFCHMCFFEVQCHPNGTVPMKKMMVHCQNSGHKTLGLPCPAWGCGVRVRTDRELRLHIGFLHPHLVE